MKGGYTLYTIKKQKGLPWDLNDSLKILYCIANALRDIIYPSSSRFIVHRDLHFGNIMLRKGFNFDDSVKNECMHIVILDFGVHKNLLADFLKGGTYKDYFRHPGGVSTWSPELLKNPEKVDAHHDIWALGVLFYRLLTTKYPIYVGSFSELYEKLVLNFQIDWMEIEKLKLHWAIEQLIKKMLAQEPKDRILLPEIVNICNDILNNNLLTENDDFIKFYMEHDGNIVKCTHCGKLIAHTGSMCPACGVRESDWLDWWM